MTERNSTSRFQEAIETVEQLPAGDQALLIEIIRQHLLDERRIELSKEIGESRTDYQSGAVKRGTAAELMKELAK